VKIKVRVSETDLLGHINNKSYFDYIEESRNDFYISANIPLDDTYTFILAKVCCTFLQQGYFGETLHLETYPREIGHKSATLVTKIYKDEKKELIAKGESIVVYFDLKKQISLQIPEEIKEILLRYRREEYD